MAVPSTYASQELARARQFILDRIRGCRVAGDRVLGDPYVSYEELLLHVDRSYTIDDEYDAARSGIIPGELSIEDNNMGRPLIGALVVHGGAPGSLPGRGFFTLVQSFGHTPQDRDVDPSAPEEMAYWWRQVLELVRQHG